MTLIDIGKNIANYDLSSIDWHSSILAGLIGVVIAFIILGVIIIKFLRDEGVL